MKYITITLALTIISFCVCGQTEKYCGTDDLHDSLMKADTTYRKNFEKARESIRTLLEKKKASKSTTATILTVPVVVHILHTGDALGSIYNPTDAKIQGDIDYLNRVFSGTYSSEDSSDAGIKFVLAKRDPDCNYTNGITRTDASYIPGYAEYGVRYGSSQGAYDYAIKDAVRWNTAEYYNIYVVKKFGVGGLLGYANYPTISNYDYDGTVLTAGAMIQYYATLPHEMGHAFDLMHTFSGATTIVCSVNTDCNLNGDQVCDTDPITQSGLCRTGTNSCTGMPYSINTEHNHMSYSHSCHTLFTQGQAARMQAAATAIPTRSVFNNSLGAFAPNEGSEQCPPVLHFNKDYDSLTLAGASNNGCRQFKDYKYFVTIANKPNIAANVSLYFSGSATEHTDFDVFTGNNLVNPSKNIVFAANIDTPQSFWIRIYSVPSTAVKKDLIVAYTLNANGGNAVAGNTMDTLRLIYDAVDRTPQKETTDYFVFADSAVRPFTFLNSIYPSRKSQMVYQAAELKEGGCKAGNISGISLYFIKRSKPGAKYNGFTIKLNHTSQKYAYNSSTSDRPLDDLNHTIYHTSDFVVASGWNDFMFATPFVWDGTSNIAMTLCYNSTNSDTSDPFKYYKYDSLQSGNPYGSPYVVKGIPCSDAFGVSGFGGYTAIKPATRFILHKEETVVQTVASGKQEYIGPYADVFFYDSVDNKLIARIKNLSDFDYGCTALTIDRSGNSALPFWNNSMANYVMQKTFKVMPEHNSDTGKYMISLYYIPAEINGWKQITGKNLDSIQLLKTKRAISLVTPSNPGAAGTIDFAFPVRDSVGTIKVLTSMFNDGFSGFAAGSLINQIYTFNGNGNWTNPSNWENNTIPPSTLPEGSAIIINPLANGECLLNTNQTIIKGAILKIAQGKRFRLLNNFQLN